MTPYIICELGSSPAPDWDLPTWVSRAAETGADAVKIQLFQAKHFPETEWESKKQLEFPRERVAEFADLAHRYGMQAGASVFDAEAVNFAAKCLDFFKLASREQANGELTTRVMTKAASTGKPVYRSITHKLQLWTAPVRLVHFWTVPIYPTGLVKAFMELSKAYRVFGAVDSRPALQWGWSSHTRTGAECIAAVRIGAGTIERHFCLTGNEIEGAHSSTPQEFARLVRLCKGVG